MCTEVPDERLFPPFIALIGELHNAEVPGVCDFSPRRSMQFCDAAIPNGSVGSVGAFLFLLIFDVPGRRSPQAPAVATCETMPVYTLNDEQQAK